jgi:hypothetical protein
MTAAAGAANDDGHATAAPWSAMKITWERTVINGTTAPEDYSARDENGRIIGRVYRHHGGRWFYAFQAHGPDITWPNGPTSGTADEKQDAADAVRAMFEKCLKYLKARGG